MIEAGGFDERELLSDDISLGNLRLGRKEKATRTESDGRGGGRRRGR